MAVRNVLRDFNIFVDGIGYLGSAKEYTPPILTIATEDFRGAGMDAPAPMDMGMEALETSITFGSYEPEVMKAWGRLGATTQLEARGALQDLAGSDAVPIVHTMQGKFTGLEQAAWTKGQASDVKVTAKLVYYKLEIGGETVHEIDVENGVRIIDGVDQLESIRDAIGA